MCFTKTVQEGDSLIKIGMAGARPFGSSVTQDLRNFVLQASLQFDPKVTAPLPLSISQYSATSLGTQHFTLIS